MTARTTSSSSTGSTGRWRTSVCSAANGTGYSFLQRYDGDIPGWGGLAAHDRLVLGDFDGDRLCDVYIFNGDDWSMAYLGMFRSTGKGLAYVHRYDGDVPGWDGLGRHDRFIAADVSGDGRCDLWVWNHDDWSTEYLGVMRSTGPPCRRRTSETGWGSGTSDRSTPSRSPATSAPAARPVRGYPQLYVHNTNWFGVIHGRGGIGLDRIYYRWIHDYRYGRNW